MNPSSDQLPIHSVLGDIKSALNTHHELILQAAPGAGKTTVVPLTLLNESWLAGQQIIMLQPRRVAARAAAERMAQLLDEKPGERIGYQVRQGSKVSDRTRIIVMTEGVLTRRLQADPSLNGIGLLIFDEFHERNLDSDLALTLCREGRSVFRDEDYPLKLLIMSATLDGMNISSFLNDAPIIKSEGKSYPVELKYDKKITPINDIVNATTQTVRRALEEYSGNALVFLPGQSEIHRVRDLLTSTLPDNVHILPLHGGLSLTEQRRAIMPLLTHETTAVHKTMSAHKIEGQLEPRKVVLATDIAETSLTIEGINIVIDSGLSRSPEYDPNTGLTRLLTRRVSRASSVQRAGRAGRLSAGVCYRLWTQSQQDALVEQNPPEILQTDLTPLALQLLQWGVSDFCEVEWLTSPPAGTFRQAIALLKSLGGLQQKGGSTQLTKHGQAMASLPTHPRLAHMLLIAAKHGLAQQACHIAALLSERDTLRYIGSDFALRMDIVNALSPCPKSHKAWLERIKRQSQQYQSLIRHLPIENHFKMDHTSALGFLLCSAYPDRIAQRQDKKSQNKKVYYKLSNGRSAVLHDSDTLNTSQWLIAVDVGGKKEQKEDYIFLAARIESAMFDDQLQHITRMRDVTFWDIKQGRLIAQTRIEVGSLTIQTQPLRNINPEQIAHALVDFIRENGLDVLSWSDQDKHWQARVQLLREYDNTHNWPDVSDTQLLASLEKWLQPFLVGVNSLDELRRLSLTPILSSFLDWSLAQKMDVLAPKTILVPSGSNITIDYLQLPPVLPVKLQEMFGCTETPAIIYSKLPLMVHLLSPARRPVQVTQDLAGFWKNTYQQVKKELKGRYPKHPWPDDPLNAHATRFTKKRMS